jgi:hypothetical protein
MPPARLLPSVSLTALLFAGPLLAQPPKAVDETPVKNDEPVKAEPKPDPRVAAQQAADKKALEAAGLTADDPAGLVKYLKSRTLDTAQIGTIMALVKRMNADAAFDDRLAAQDELLKMGGLAADVLKKQAKDNPDAEIRFRALDTLRRLEKSKLYGSELTAAVVRALGRVKSDEAAAALFAYLPLADSAAVVEQIQEAMTANAGDPGKPARVLTDALADADPLRRQVAAVALASGGTPARRVRFPDLLAKLIDIAKADKEPAVRFAVAKALLLECREREGVAALIDLMPGMTRGQSWQAEELLAQVAGKDTPAPKERCVHARDGNNKETQASKDARVKCRDAWKKWWEAAAPKTDLAKTEVRLTVRGELVVVTTGYANTQQINLVEYGADEKEKGRSTFANQNGNLFDAIVRDDGTVLTLDYYLNQVQVRDAAGVVKKGWGIADKNANRFGFQAKGLTQLDNGNVIAMHQSGFSEFDRDGKVVLTYTRPEVNKNQVKNDLCGVVKMKTGEYVVHVMNQAQNQGELVVLDAKGKEAADKKPVKVTSPPYYRNTLLVTGDDKVMLFDQNNGKMQEYDLKTGKATDGGAKWTSVSSPMSIQRLPNGNILLADSGYRKLTERAPDGTEVWSMSNLDNSGNTQLVRAFVR